jgi:hypothetical protein
VHIPAGQTKTVTFTLGAEAFSIVDATGRRFVEPGSFLITVGGGQPIAVAGTEPPTVSSTLSLSGSVYVVQL